MTDSATAMPPLCFSTLCKISWKSDRRRDVTSHQERVEGPHQQWLGAVSTTQLSVNSSAIARERERPLIRAGDSLWHASVSCVCLCRVVGCRSQAPVRHLLLRLKAAKVRLSRATSALTLSEGKNTLKFIMRLPDYLLYISRQFYLTL